MVPAKETVGTEAPGANAPAGAAASAAAEQGAEQVLVGETLKSTTPLPPSAEKWRQWWTIPLWIGVEITLVGSLFMYAVFLANGFSFWFLCAGLPFAFGLLLIILAVESRRAKWLHLRGSKNRAVNHSILPLAFRCRSVSQPGFSALSGATSPACKILQSTRLSLRWENRRRPKTRCMFRK